MTIRVVHPSALDQLVQLLDSRPEIGLCGPKLVDAEGRLSLSCRLFPTLLDKLGRRFPSVLTRKAARQIELAELADWAHDTLRAVDYVIGACQLIRRRALDEVGLLDERIFTVRKMSIYVCACTRRVGRWSTSRPRW